MLAEGSVEIRELVRARVRRGIAELDYRRALVKVADAGVSQRQIARQLSISQPSVQGALARAQDVSMPVEGFSGATPMEICQRYAAGLLDRSQLVEELGRWQYAPGGQGAGDIDGLVVDPPGAWSEVELAVDLGLIDDSIYEDVFFVRHPDLARAAQQR